MGPRSHERGNALTPVRATARVVLLQWGRVLMNAETRSLEAALRVSLPLQWGRVLMNAETLAWPVRRRPTSSCFNGAAFS